MVGASCANWRLCLTCLSLLLVVPIERPHGLQQTTYTPSREDLMDRTKEQWPVNSYYRSTAVWDLTVA